MKTISIKTKRRNEMLDITSIVYKTVKESGMKDGGMLCLCATYYCRDHYKRKCR